MVSTCPAVLRVLQRERDLCSFGPLVLVSGQPVERGHKNLWGCPATQTVCWVFLRGACLFCRAARCRRPAEVRLNSTAGRGVVIAIRTPTWAELPASKKSCLRSVIFREEERLLLKRSPRQSRAFFQGAKRKPDNTRGATAGIPSRRRPEDTSVLHGSRSRSDSVATTSF